MKLRSAGETRAVLSGAHGSTEREETNRFQWHEYFKHGGQQTHRFDKNVANALNLVCG